MFVKNFFANYKTAITQHYARHTTPIAIAIAIFPWLNCCNWSKKVERRKRTVTHTCTSLHKL